MAERIVAEWILGAILVTLSCCAAAGTVAACLRALEQEAAAVAAERYPGEVGYQRFTERTSSIMLVGASIGVVPLVLPAVLLPLVGRLPALAGAPVDLLSLRPGAVILLVGFGFLLDSLTFELLSAALVRSQALVRLRGTPSRPGIFLALALKRVLLWYLPLMLVVAAIGLPLALDQPALLWLAVPALLLWYLPNYVFTVRVLAWLRPTEPIERTRWAALEHRIRGWGERAGLPIAAIRIWRTAASGSSTGYIVSSRKRTLFLADLFLENSEWRQQDALVCLGLGLIRQRGRLLLLPAVKLFYWAVVVAGVVLVLGGMVIPGGLSPALPGLPSPMLLGPSAALLLGLPMFGLAVAILMWQSAIYSRLVLDADRYAATLTGDPLALIVLLHTATALDGTSRQTYLPGQLRTEQRVAALDALMRQPGPKAPWASAPVPALVQVLLGPYSLTVPLAPAAPAGLGTTLA